MDRVIITWPVPALREQATAITVDERGRQLVRVCSMPQVHAATVAPIAVA